MKLLKFLGDVIFGYNNTEEMLKMCTFHRKEEVLIILLHWMCVRKQMKMSNFANMEKLQYLLGLHG